MSEVGLVEIGSRAATVASAPVGNAPDWGHATEFDDISGRVAIAGIGETAYTKASGRTASEIGAEAAERAIADCGLRPEDIDGLTYNAAFADFDVAAFHEHFGTHHDMWSSPWGGGMSWAGTAPALAAGAIARGEARHVLNVFPVAWATQRASMTGGPGEVHASQALKQNLEVPLGFFPQPVYFATIMRRHMLEFGTTAGAVRCDRGRVPSAREPPSGRSDARQADDARRLLALDGARRPAAPVRLVPHLRRRRRVRDDVDRASARPAAPSGRRARRGRGDLGHGQHWSQQRAFTSTPQVFSAPGAFAMAGLTPADVDVLTLYDPFTVVALMQIEDMGFCAKGEGGAFVEGETLWFDRGRLPYNTHGGLLSHAYVLGIAHVVEIVKQLRGTAAGARSTAARSRSTAGTPVSTRAP